MTIEHQPTLDNNNVDQNMLMNRIPKTGVLEKYSDQIDHYLPEHLQHQITHIFDLYRAYNEKLPETIKRSEKDFKFLEHFYASFLTDRNRRSEEVSSDRYKKVVDKALNIIKIPIYYRLCMDGRVKVVHTNGLTADTAGSIRTPGASLNEFERLDGTLVLIPGSNYAQRLDQARQKNKFSAQGVDSHLKCAARKGEEEATGNYVGQKDPETNTDRDNGLFRDVIHKSEEIQASKEYLKSKKEGGKVFFIQTTFNPITGYMYMGLETEAAKKVARDKARVKAKNKGKDPENAVRYSEYTKDVIKDSIEKGLVISTGHIITEPQIRAVFEREFFQPDRINKYVETAENFWNKIGILWEELSPTLKESVLKVYPHLDHKEEEAKLELETRAMFLLTNAFNSYIHNKDHNEMEYLEMDDEKYEHQEHYKYGKHDEAGVKISEGGHPPYNIPMFVIYSEDIENLSDRIELSSQLVRKNRMEQRVLDSSEQFVDPEEFAMAPVPVVMQEIIRDLEEVKINTHEWEHLEQVAWDDLPKNWDSMKDDELTDYLNKKGIGNSLLIKGILKLRRKMARIYDPSQSTAHHLKDLYKTVMPIVCDEDRKTHAIIPFLKVAREDNNHQG